MTKIKLCGLTRPCDIEAVNSLAIDYIGFVFWPKSKRNVTPEQAKKLRSGLRDGIQAVGVFVDAPQEEVLRLLAEGIIDVAQLHGKETEKEIRRMKELSGKPIFKAFKIRSEADVLLANASPADMVLLDSGMGTGVAFNWELIQGINRPYLLAGGLGISNIEEAMGSLQPYGVDVSSGIETDGYKDREKMKTFVEIVRKCEAIDR